MSAWVVHSVQAGKEKKNRQLALSVCFPEKVRRTSIDEWMSSVTHQWIEHTLDAGQTNIL